MSLRALVLEQLAARPRTSGGNLTRRLMGVGHLPQVDDSYTAVKAVLDELLAEGLVKRDGNGKGHQYRLATQ